MIKVRGKNVLMYVLEDEVYIPAICATNLTRSQGGGTLATLVRGAGRARRYRGTLNEETVTLEGLLTFEDPPGFRFYEFVVHEFYTVRIIYDDDNGNTLQLDGEVLITGINDNNGATDFSTWSITMVRNGTWAQTGTGVVDEDPPTVVRARATGSNQVRVTFSEGVVPTAAGWTVYIADTTTTLTILSVAGSGDTWFFTTSGLMATGQDLFLNYEDGTGNTTDYSLNEMADLVMFPIYNVIIGVAPFTAYVNYFNTDPFLNFSTGVDPLPWANSGTFPTGSAVSLPLTGFPTGKWVAIKVPLTESVKTNWFNTSFNYGTLPDSVFRSPITPSTPNGFRYYLTRLATNFDTTQPLTIS